MAVISIKDDVVWGGGNRHFCMAIFDYCESSLGRCPFVVRFKTSFEHGYNAADLGRESDDAVRKFRSCVDELARNADSFNRDWLGSCYDPKEIETALRDLVDLIDRERLNAP